MATTTSTENVVLRPNPRLPIIILIIGILLIFLPPIYILGIITSVFAIFLLIQTLILRLEFTKDALRVTQLNRELRKFPYKDWLAWRIFLPLLPGILYFREEASPHLLPILFDPNELQQQLRLRLPKLERPQ